ncbi:MAG: hypothetical protein UX10_C0016G0013 [Candidatus Magasanikbacteria bacterium GW2011_GWA2_45_39]|uniref:Glycosyltransferase family 1 protein n=1 Tax=Candidatus Magasanikbacteria bacterium GW2011_GWA2_45_39 TaxID=1619041 RepID=A0A0G1PNS2_9BACT|nr:MAG: hypothetical protein UX10_C0016G0013 [Candidatus Magasanikbacteria bacterium GW2011_GWA2_45_39]
MRIGIDARFLGDDGGIARYVKRLVENLERIDHENEYVIFLRLKNWEEYHPSNPHFTKQLADIPWYGFKEQLLIAFSKQACEHAFAAYLFFQIHMLPRATQKSNARVKTYNSTLGIHQTRYCPDAPCPAGKNYRNL